MIERAPARIGCRAMAQLRGLSHDADEHHDRQEGAGQIPLLHNVDEHLGAFDVRPHIPVGEVCRHQDERGDVEGDGVLAQRLPQRYRHDQGDDDAYERTDDVASHGHSAPVSFWSLAPRPVERWARRVRDAMRRHVWHQARHARRHTHTLSLARSGRTGIAPLRYLCPGGRLNLSKTRAPACGARTAICVRGSNDTRKDGDQSRIPAGKCLFPMLILQPAR